jgi:hypothetical protein
MPKQTQSNPISKANDHTGEIRKFGKVLQHLASFPSLNPKKRPEMRKNTFGTNFYCHPEKQTI